LIRRFTKYSIISRVLQK